MFDWLTKGIEGPLGAVLALCAVGGLVVALRRWQHRAGDNRRATTEPRAVRREAEEVRRSLEGLLAEVESATARLEDRIAARIAALEDAEQRIDARLQCVAGAESGLSRPSSMSSPGADLNSGAGQALVEQASLLAAVRTRTPIALESHAATRFDGAKQRRLLLKSRLEREVVAQAPGPVAIREGVIPDPVAPIALDARFTRVYELSDAGVAAMDVAAQTGMLLGEIELVLGLRRLTTTER